MTVIAEPLTALQQTVAPRLRVKNAPAAIEFYKNAFGARELMRFSGGGRIAHAELAIGNSIVMLGEEAPGVRLPEPGGARADRPSGMHLYVDDAEPGWSGRWRPARGWSRRSAISFMAIAPARVADPFGYAWTIATHKDEMSVDEMQRRMAAMMAERQPQEASTFIPKGFPHRHALSRRRGRAGLHHVRGGRVRRRGDAPLDQPPRHARRSAHRRFDADDRRWKRRTSARPAGHANGSARLRRGRRRGLPAGARCRRIVDWRPGRSAIWRTRRRREGSFRQCLVHRDGEGRALHPRRSACGQRVSASAACGAAHQVPGAGARRNGRPEVRRRRMASCTTQA